MNKVAISKQVINQLVKVERITPFNQNCFFGYFDILASKDNRYLSLRYPVINELPIPTEHAEICIINPDKSVEIIDKTKSWCFQQGNFLQFIPKQKDQIIYNIFNEKKGKYNSVIYNTATKEKRFFSLPFANVSPDGSKALSINFSRLYDYRPGYGYSNIDDPNASVIAPDNDGIFEIDLETGKNKLLISYERLQSLFAKGSKLENKKIIVNHINFNTDGTKFLFLLRWFSNTAPWPTMTIVADADGSNIKKIFGFGSHYHWKDTNHVAVTGCENVSNNNIKKITLYEIDVRNGSYQQIDSTFFQGDGHCSYSPDRRFMIYDSYSSTSFPYRKLQVYDLTKKKGVTAGFFYSHPDIWGNITDCRCDLHPRWSDDGKTISFDSVHEGFRGIYKVNIDDVIEIFDKDYLQLNEDEINLMVDKYFNNSFIKNKKIIKTIDNILLSLGLYNIINRFVVKLKIMKRKC